MDLFPFIKVLFSDKKKYTQLKSNDKGKNFFMVNRFMSIKFPSTAQQLNRNGINGSAVMDLWHIVASRFGRVPGWIYTKTKKVKNEKVWKPDSMVSTIWMERHGLGEKDLSMAIKLNPDEMKKSFKRIEKQIRVHAQ